MLCGAAMLLSIDLRLGLHSATTVSLVLFTFLEVVFLSLYWIFSGKVSDRQAMSLFPKEENKGLFYEHTRELTDTGMTESSPVDQQSTSPRCGDAFTYFHLHWRQHGPRHSTRKAVEGDADPFVEQLKETLAANRAPEPIVPQPLTVHPNTGSRDS